MPNFNIDNNVTLTGRVMTQDIQKGIFKNSDGSRKMRFTIGVQNNYRDSDGKYGIQAIPVEVFIPAAMVKAENGAESLGIYDTIRTGDLITVSAHIMDNNYKDKKTGEMVYGGIIVRVDSFKHRESKAVSEARAEKKDPVAAGQAAVAAEAEA